MIMINITIGFSNTWYVDIYFSKGKPQLLLILNMSKFEAAHIPKGIVKILTQSMN